MSGQSEGDRLTSRLSGEATAAISHRREPVVALASKSIAQSFISRRKHALRDANGVVGR